MQPVQRRRRKWLIVLPVSLLGVALALWALPSLLARLAQQRLSRFAEGTLLIQRVRLTHSSVILEELTIRDADALVRAERVELSDPVGLLLGNDHAPARIRISGLYLRCVRVTDGQWRWVLPFRPPARTQPPTIIIDGLTVELPGGVRLHSVGSWTIKPAGEPYVIRIEGALRTPAQEVLHGTAQLDRRTAAARVVIRCEAFDLSLPWLSQVAHLGEMLREKGWQAAGRAELEATFTHEPNRPWNQAWTYEGRLALRNANVTVGPGIEATNLSGRVVLTPGRVQFHGVAGTFAEGAVAIRGEIGTHTALELELKQARLTELLLTPAALRSQLRDVMLNGSLVVQGGMEPDTWTGKLTAHLTGPVLPASGLSLSATIEQGRLCVDEATWRWGGGTFTVQAHGHLGNRELEANVRLANVRLSDAMQALGFDLPVNASVNAQLALGCHLPDWLKPRAWSVRGTLKLDGIETPDQPLGHVSIVVHKGPNSEQLKLEQVVGLLYGIPLAGSGSVDLVDRRWALRIVTAQAVPASLLTQFCPPYVELPQPKGLVRADLECEGQLPDSWRATLRLASKELRWGSETVASVQVLARLDRSGHVFFSSSPLNLAGGTFQLEGTFAWAPQRNLRLTARITDVEASRLARLLTDQPPPVSGSVSGQVELRWACRPDAPIECGLAVQSPLLQFDRLRMANLRALLRWDGTALHIDHWAAQLPKLGPATGRARWPDEGNRRRVALDEVWLTELDLAKLVRNRHGASLCYGVARAELTGYLDLETRRLHLVGSAQAPELRWTGLPPAKAATAQVELDGETLKLSSLQATACNGRVALDIHHTIGPVGRTEVSASLAEVDLNQLLSAHRRYDPTFLSGIVHGEGRITVERGEERSKVMGVGHFRLSRARLARIPVRHARGVVYYDGQAYDIVFEEMAVGNGWASGTLTLRPGRPTEYRASFAFEDISLPFLGTSVLELRHPVAGFVNGSLELEGTTEGWHTTRGAIYVTELRDAELWKLPLFHAIAEFLLPGVTRPGVFHNGKGKIGIESGVLVLDGFGLRGAAAQIYIRRGRIWPDGRLELEIIGNAETFIPPQAPVVRILRRMADTVQHRLIKFQVTGTVDHPRVRAIPLADVSGAAVRLFRELMSGRFLPEAPPSRR